MNSDRHLKGLGGWLVFVAVGIIIAPLQLCFQLIPMYSDIFSNRTFTALISPGSNAFNPLLFSILVFEMTVNGALIIAWIFLAILFFSRKRLFPKLYIAVLIFTLVFLLLDSLAIQFIFPDMQVFDPENVRTIGRSLLVILIWVPYMIRSKRVKATFIRTNRPRQSTSAASTEADDNPDIAAKL